MALFLSRYDNKVDKKGRVSVPAPYRAALASQNFAGIVAYPSPVSDAVECCGMDRMERLAAGAVDPRTGRVVQEDYANWTTHPNNPMAPQAAE